MASYEEEFKKRIVRMHLEEGRTIKSLSEEYHVSENGIGYWLKKYREECSKNPAAKEEYDLMKENLRLRKELEEAKSDGNMRYNCTIIDLYDRSVIASVSGKKYYGGAWNTGSCQGNKSAPMGSDILLLKAFAQPVQP